MARFQWTFPLNYSLLLLVVAEVVKKGVDSLIEDIKAPNYLDIEDNLWKGVSDFVLIPKKTVMNAKGGTYYLLGQNTPKRCFGAQCDDLHFLKGNVL